MRILVTGATGFVGSHLVPFLVSKGCEVDVLLRASSELPWWWPDDIKPTCHHHDGTSDGMTRVVADAQPDVVIHLATHFVAEHRQDDIRNLCMSNIEFGLQLLDAMAANNVRTLVNAGTAWQHFESEDYSPVSLYAATKQAFQDIAQFYIDAHNFKAITLKLSDSYGPHDTRSKLVPLLLRLANQSDVPQSESTPFSPGEQLLDLVHVDDVVHAFYNAATLAHVSPEPGHQVYSVSSKTPLPLKEIIGIFEEECGKNLQIKFGERPYREREVMKPWQSETVPGWSPKIDLSSGFRMTIESSKNTPSPSSPNETALVSFVAPCFNEYENIEPLANRIRATMDSLSDYDFEIMFVENGSNDGSDELLHKLHDSDPRIRMVKLSRNFGYQGAITAGLNHCTGDWVVVLDGDQQDPPELVPELIKKAEEGFDVVYGVRVKRLGSRTKTLMYMLFYRVYGLFADIEVPHDAGEFCLMHRKVVDGINGMPERQRFTRGLRTWVGFRQTNYEYTRVKRAAGETKFNLIRMISLAFDGILSFSLVPLRMSIVAGLVTVLIAIFLSGMHLLSRLMELSGYHDVALVLPPGLTQINITIVFLFGVTIFCVGIVGEYVGRIYNEVKRRPHFIVDEILGEQTTSSSTKKE